MARNTLSTMTQLVEARAQIRQAHEAAKDDRPELAASLAELMADMDELRWKLSEEEATSQWRYDRKEGSKSGETPE